MAHEHTTGASAEGAASAARLREVQRWLAIICFGFAPFEFGFGMAWGNQILLAVSAIALVVGGLSVLGIWLTNRGQISTSASLLGATILVGALVVLVVAPSVTAGITIVPLLIMAMLLPYLPQYFIRPMSLLVLVAAPAIFVIGTLLPPLFPPLPTIGVLVLGTIMVASTSGLTMLLFGQFSAQLVVALAQANTANTALGVARDMLEQQVAERTSDLRTAMADLELRAAAQARLLDENADQRQTIREMSVPVLPISTSAIVIPLVGALDSARIAAMQEQALHAIEHSATRYVLLDITGVPVVDTLVAKGLFSIVQAARLLGAEVVLVGVRPEVAQSIVGLGLDMHQIPTHQSLQAGLAYIASRESQRRPALAAR